MKKIFLLAVALLCASSLMANTAAQRAKALPKMVSTIEECPMQLATEVFDQMAEPGDKPNKVIRKVLPADGSPRAFYKRPAGAFYGFVKVDENNGFKYSSYYTPYIVGWPHHEATYVPNTLNIGENPTYNWRYQLYNRTAQEYEWLEASGDTLVVDYWQELDTVPYLSAEGSEGFAEYVFCGWSTSGSGSSKQLNQQNVSRYMARPDLAHTFSNTTTSTLYQSSKYRAASTNRDGTNLSGGTYSSGALDAEGGKTGRWYGRNFSGVDELSMAFEKPEHPYVLRKVGVAFQNLAFANEDPCDLTVTVYKLNEIPAYADTAVYAQPGEVVAIGTFNVVPSEFTNAGVTSGIMEFELIAEDDGSGLEITVEPEIDFPILVVLSGYNNPTISDFTLTQSTDLYDEGYGELCYLGRTQADGSILYKGLNHFFSSGERKSGISIYIDTYRPYFVWNYLSETGVYTFPNEGGEHSVEVFSFNNAEEWEITNEDGGDIPAWLNIEAEDEIENDEWTGVVFLKASAQQLPTGVNYREAKIRLHINGRTLFYTYMQGDNSVAGDVNGDRAIDLNDLNLVINIMLGKSDAATYPGADVDGNGTVELVDMNTIINILLGK